MNYQSPLQVNDVGSQIMLISFGHLMLKNNDTICKIHIEQTFAIEHNTKERLVPIQGMPL
jgi:hypothetical protein